MLQSEEEQKPAPIANSKPAPNVQLKAAAKQESPEEEDSSEDEDSSDEEAAPAKPAGKPAAKTEPMEVDSSEEEDSSDEGEEEAPKPAQAATQTKAAPEVTYLLLVQCFALQLIMSAFLSKKLQMSLSLRLP